MENDYDKKWIIAYIIILLCLACLFAGHEAAMIIHEMDKENAIVRSMGCVQHGK